MCGSPCRSYTRATGIGTGTLCSGRAVHAKRYTWRIQPRGNSPPTYRFESENNVTNVPPHGRHRGRQQGTAREGGPGPVPHWSLAPHASDAMKDTCPGARVTQTRTGRAQAHCGSAVTITLRPDHTTHVRAGRYGARLPKDVRDMCRRGRRGHRPRDGRSCTCSAQLTANMPGRCYNGRQRHGLSAFFRVPFCSCCDEYSGHVRVTCHVGR